MASLIHLFLDVDGVLHPIKRRFFGSDAPGMEVFMSVRTEIVGPPLSRLPIFEETVRPYLGQLELVVISDWRLHERSIEVLRSAMSPDFRDRLSFAPAVRTSGEQPRFRLIDIYRRDTGKLQSPFIWCAIDDDPSAYGIAANGRVIECRSNVGFDDAAAHAFRSWMADPFY